MEQKLTYAPVSNENINTIFKIYLLNLSSKKSNPNKLYPQHNLVKKQQN
jgi:hypothetical protein